MYGYKKGKMNIIEDRGDYLLISIDTISMYIDKMDYEKLKGYKWYLDKVKAVKHKLFYFTAYLPRVVYLAKPVRISLHREVMNCTIGDGKIIDHINGNTLDNRRQNLRYSTFQENALNCRLSKRNKTGYKGLCFDKQHNAYIVYKRVNGKMIRYGQYKDINDAITKVKEVYTV